MFIVNLVCIILKHVVKKFQSLSLQGLQINKTEFHVNVS